MRELFNAVDFMLIHVQVYYNDLKDKDMNCLTHTV